MSIIHQDPESDNFLMRKRLSFIFFTNILLQYLTIFAQHELWIASVPHESSLSPQQLLIKFITQIFHLYDILGISQFLVCKKKFMKKNCVLKIVYEKKKKTVFWSPKFNHSFVFFLQFILFFSEGFLTAVLARIFFPRLLRTFI